MHSSTCLIVSRFSKYLMISLCSRKVLRLYPQTKDFFNIFQPLITLRSRSFIRRSQTICSGTNSRNTVSAPKVPLQIPLQLSPTAVVHLKSSMMNHKLLTFQKNVAYRFSCHMWLYEDGSISP